MKITLSLLSVFVGVGVVLAGDSGLRSTDNKRTLQDNDCDSISDAVCGLGDQYSTMCDLMKNETAFPSDKWEFGTKKYTAFIPDDTAWDLFKPSMDGLSQEELGRIVEFHFYEGIELPYDELECGETLTAVSTDTSRTKCDQGHGAEVKHQNGNGNTIQESLPTITNSNVDFCNGVAHTIDHLMLPVHLEEFVSVDPTEDHHKDSPDKMRSSGGGGSMTGTSYCTYSPDKECYSSGWPDCCSSSDPNDCPDERPSCDSNDTTGTSYCTYAPDTECYSSGWPDCCSSSNPNDCPDERPSCDSGRYCVFAPDPTCYDGGWPECCQDDNKGCPDTQPPCDKSAAYCVWSPNFDCYAGGWPACCLEDYTGCPNDIPECEKTTPVVGASYCVYAPDAGCYKDGWPDCCMNNGGASCPEEQPGCNFQCNRECTSRGECANDGGVWDPGMPWCGGTCADGHCQPVIEACGDDSDCGDKAICGVYGYCIGKTPYVNQCGRNCSGNSDCSNDGGKWDTGSPWCGMCEDGHCRANLEDCSSDSDCSSDVSVCGPTIPGGGRFCVGK